MWQDFGSGEEGTKEKKTWESEATPAAKMGWAVRAEVVRPRE